MVIEVDHQRLFCWRRGQDSNLRCAYAHTRFPSVPIKPLWHLSDVMRSVIFVCIVLPPFIVAATVQY